MPESFSLSTKRLVLRPFVEDDLVDLQRFHANRQVQSGYDLNAQPWSNAAIAERLKAYIRDHEKHGFSRWKLSLTSGEFVGRAGLGWYAAPESVELGYGLLPDYWGCGYAQEVGKALIRWGFNHFPITKIVAFTLPGNGRSVNTLVALGLAYVDDRRRSVSDGVCPYFEITRHEADALGY